VGAKLARDDGLAFNIHVARNGPIASKLSSYRDWWRTQNPAPGEEPIVGAHCGSKACSRWRSGIQHPCRPKRPLREQAQLLQELAAHAKSRTRRRSSCRSTLWEQSLLAMTVWHSTSMSPETAPSRASSAPTGIGSAHKSCTRRRSNCGSTLWEQSLLAMTVWHSTSMSPETAPSRASSAPTGIGSAHKSRTRQRSKCGSTCGSKACSRWRSGIQHPCRPKRPHREQAQLLQGLVPRTKSCTRRRNNCGSEPARDGGLTANNFSSEIASFCRSLSVSSTFQCRDDAPNSVVCLKAKSCAITGQLPLSPR